MIEQLSFLAYDFKRALGKNKLRILNVFFSRAFTGLIKYRLERGGYLLFGKLYALIRIVFLPILYLADAYSNSDIHYKAKIGKGIKILHPSLGVVVSGKVEIGNHLTLVGGNCIGVRSSSKGVSYILGNNIEMGANATIIGPLVLGNNIQIGANACVVKSFMMDNIILIGVPAEIKSN